MIKINLLDEVKAGSKDIASVARGEAKAGVTPDQQKQNIIFGVEIGIALVIIALWYFALSGKLSDLNDQRIEKERELREVQKLIEEVDKFRAQKALLEKQINLIEELKMKQQGPADLMKRLYNLLPDQVFLLKLTKNESAVNIKGTSLNDSALSNFYEKLGESQHFVGIVPGKKIRKDTGIEFEVSCRFIIDPEREKKMAELAKKKKPNRPGQPGANPR